MLVLSLHIKFRPIKFVLSGYRACKACSSSTIAQEDRGFLFFFFCVIMCISGEAPFFKGKLDAKSSSSHPKAFLRRRKVTRIQEVNYSSSPCNTMAKVNVKSQTRSSLLCLLFLETATNSLLHVVTKEKHTEIIRFMDLGT